MPDPPKGPCSFEGSVAEVVVRGEGPAVLLEKEAFPHGTATLSPAQVGTSSKVLVLDHPAWLDPVGMNAAGQAFHVVYRSGPPVEVRILEGGKDEGGFRGKLHGAPECATKDCELRWAPDEKGKQISLAYDGAGEDTLVASMPFPAAKLHEIDVRGANGTRSCAGSAGSAGGAEPMRGDQRWGGAELSLGWVKIGKGGLRVHLQGSPLPELPEAAPAVQRTPGALGAPDTQAAPDAQGAAGKPDAGTGNGTPDPPSPFPFAQIAVPLLGAAALTAFVLLRLRRVRISPSSAAKEPILPVATLQKLHGAAIAADLANSRDALFAGLDPGFVAGLPDAPSAASRLLTDLSALNRAGRLRDGSVPLAVWLSMAVTLAGLKAEAAIFQEALDEVKRKLP